MGCQRSYALWNIAACLGLGAFYNRNRMNIYLTYGFAITLVNALVTLVCYLLGFHSDPDKIQMAGFIAMPVGLAVGITATTLGMRAKCNATPSTEEFGYGQAFATGFMIALFAALFGGIFHYIYLTFIN